MLYEPGPLQPLDPSRFPRPGDLVADIVSAVVPQSAAMLQAEAAQSTIVSTMAGNGIPDIDGDHARQLRPAYDEVAAQHHERGGLDVSEAVYEAGASAAEYQGLADQLPAEDSDYEEPQIPGEGTDDIPASNNPADLGIDPTGLNQQPVP